MNWLSHRKKIEGKYKEWLKKERKASDSAFNLISFLEIEGLLKNLMEIHPEWMGPDLNTETPAAKLNTTGRNEVSL